MLNQSHFLPGAAFWYRSGGSVYGAVIVDYQEDFGDYLVAISEAIDPAKCPPDRSAVLDAPLYTVAWFSAPDMLPRRRLHHVGDVVPEGDFSDRAGRLVSDGAYTLKNCGQPQTWKHEFRELRLPERRMKDALISAALPKMYI